MRFLYKIAWIDPSKQTTKYLSISDSNMAMYIAKEKLSQGMQQVVIYITETTNEDFPIDDNWKAIDNPGGME